LSLSDRAEALFVLTVASWLFRTLFTTALNDGGETGLLVRGVRSDVLKQILDYAYTGQVGINRDNVYDLIVASDYLSVLCLREVCCDFLKETLDVETCVGVMHFAR
jgi:hypothetical protein